MLGRGNLYIICMVNINKSKMASRRGITFVFLMVIQLVSARPQRKCRTEVSLTSSNSSATVYMPNYYDDTYPSTPYKCAWTIPAPTGYNVQLTLRDVNTTLRETLTVYARNRDKGTPTMELTGPLNYAIAPLTSSAGISLKYENAARKRDGRGFLADLILTEQFENPGEGSCGGEIFLSELIPSVDVRAPYSSPDVSELLSPKPYGQATCRWVIMAPRNKHVKIVWHTVDTKNEFIRVYDTRIRQASSRAAKLKGQINWGLAPFISSTNGIMFALEREGGLEVGNGFHVTAEITENDVVPYSCGGTYYLDESKHPLLNITSPYYDQPERTEGSIISCYWYLHAPAGKQVRLDILDTHTTPFESVRVFDGLSEATKIPLGFVYGDEGPYSVVSTQGGLQVYLEDRRLFGQNGRGFFLTASISDEFTWNVGESYPSCGQIVSLDYDRPRYMFNSLNFPTSTPNNGYTCFWTFHSPPNTLLVLELHHVQLMTQTLSVSQDGVELQKLENIPFPEDFRVQTGTNQSRVVFTGWEHSNILQGGFQAEAMFISKDFTNMNSDDTFTECGGVISLDEDLPFLTITTPDYPDPTETTYSCTWVVRVPTGSNVEITFCDFAIEAPGLIRVYDGSNLDRMVQQISGSDLPDALTSSGDVATVQYKSQGSMGGRGTMFVVRDSSYKTGVHACVLNETTEEVETTPSTAKATAITPGVQTRRPVGNIGSGSDVTPVPESASGVSVVCDSTQMTVYLNRSLFAPDINPYTLKFKDENCVAFRHDRNFFALSTRYDECETLLEQTDDYFIYSNFVEYTHVVPIPGTPITREKKDVFIRANCQITRRQTFTGLPNTVVLGVSDFSETGFGNFTLYLERFTSDYFTKTVDESAAISPNQRLYYTVNLKTEEPGFDFFIDNLWTTPSPDPLDEQKHDLITDGCNVDKTLSLYAKFAPTFQALSFEASPFLGVSDQVYVHAEAVICRSSDRNSQCYNVCPTDSRRGRRQVNEVEVHQGFKSIPHIVSRGPAYFKHSEEVPLDSGDSNSKLPEVGVEHITRASKQTLIGVLSGTIVLVIAVAIVIILIK